MASLFRYDRREHAALLWTVGRGGGLGTCVGTLAGLSSALFLLALQWATTFREAHPALLWGLPVAGYVIGIVYSRYGKSVVAGNNLLLETIHSRRGAAIPFRMVPLVLGGTLLTHLLGGSAGREGTAVQMGGTLAGVVSRCFRVSRRDYRILLMSGISGGFGAVFGTPLAGTVFGMEVLRVGRVEYHALLPCFVAALVGDVVCRACGVHHAVYAISSPLPPFTPLFFALVVLASLLFAGTATVFIEMTEGITVLTQRWITRPELRPVFGGLVIIGLTFLVGTRDYLGLSLPLIAQSFTAQGVVPWAFALKLLFTSVTLGTGFKGGEVTPLFCIGATLGAAFGQWTGQPVAVFAALGLVAVFAGAANTPLACLLMGIELFGGGLGVPLAAASIVTYILTGHRGIYASQLLGVPKASSIVVGRRTRLHEAPKKSKFGVRSLTSEKSEEKSLS